MSLSLKDIDGSQFVDPFHQAIIIPPFFHLHLLDDARVLKLLKDDPQANIRVFYYQYLKLCFQIQTPNYEVYVSKITDILNDQAFSFMFNTDDDPTIYNDTQFKKFIIQILQSLSSGQYSVDDLLNTLSFSHIVLVYFFRSILILTGRAEDITSYLDRNMLIGFLSQYFQIKTSRFQNCIRYEETDIFVYEQKQEMVYMAYINHNYDEQIEQEGDIIVQSNEKANISDQLHSYVQQKIHKNNQTIINQSYISSQFVDYTHTDLSNLTAMVKEDKIVQEIIIKQNQKQIKKQNQKQITKQIIKQNKKQIKLVNSYQEDPEKIKNQKNYQKNTIFTQNNNKTQEIFLPKLNFQNQIASTIKTTYHYDNIKSNYIPAQKQYYQSKRTSYQTNAIQSNRSQYLQLQINKINSYQNKNKMNQLHYQPNYQQKYQQNLSNNTLKQYDNSRKNKNYLDISRQMSNTFIIKQMIEPYSSNVRRMRQRARKLRDSINSNFLY